MFSTKSLLSPSGNHTCPWHPPTLSKTSTHTYSHNYKCMALSLTLHKFCVVFAPCMAPVLAYVYAMVLLLQKEATWTPLCHNLIPKKKYSMKVITPTKARSQGDTKNTIYDLQKLLECSHAKANDLKGRLGVPLGQGILETWTKYLSTISNRVGASIFVSHRPRGGE